LLLGASFFVPLYHFGIFAQLRFHKADWTSYGVLFVWYYFNFLAGIFFNSALMGCANIRLAGGKPSVGAGFRIACSRFGAIAAWAFVAATVGLVLNYFRDRRNPLLNILSAGASVAWTLLTYLIVPVLIFEDRSVFGSISRSKDLFKSHWGEQVTGNFGLGLLGFLFALPALLMVRVCWGWDPMAGVIFGAVYLLIVTAVFSAVKGIFTVALYRYATAGTAPDGFSANIIDGLLGNHRRTGF
jgi:hypothetical protein